MCSILLYIIINIFQTDIDEIEIPPFNSIKYVTKFTFYNAKVNTNYIKLITLAIMDVHFIDKHDLFSPTCI